MEKYELPVLIFGTSGASKDIYYWIKAINRDSDPLFYDVIGFIEKDGSQVNKCIFDDQKVIGCDSDISDIISNYDEIGMVIPFGSPYVRQSVVERLKNYTNIVFPNIIHPTVIYDDTAGSMGVGNHIGPGVVIESAFTFGDFNYISGAVELGHDIVLGDYNSINPSAATAGNVVFGNRNMLGINATVIQELRIGDDITIGAGSVVTKDLHESGVYVGIPSKMLHKHK